MAYEDIPTSTMIADEVGAGHGVTALFEVSFREGFREGVQRRVAAVQTEYQKYPTGARENDRTARSTHELIPSVASFGRGKAIPPRSTSHLPIRFQSQPSRVYSRRRNFLMPSIVITVRPDKEASQCSSSRSF